MVTVNPVFSACSCNLVTHASDCDPKDGLIAFGCSSLLCFWKSATNNSFVKDTYVAHTEPIFAVRFVSSFDNQRDPSSSNSPTTPPRRVVTADTKGVICVWSENPSGKWSLALTFQGCDASITALAVIDQGSNTLIFASGSNGEIRVHQLSPTLEIHHISTIPKEQLSGKYPLTLTCSILSKPSSGLILAVGLTASSFQLYVATDLKSWKRAAVIEGHTDWVRAASFSYPNEDGLLLATGSQDHYIRLWKINQVIDRTPPSDEVKSSSIEILDTLEADETNVTLSLKQYNFDVDGVKFACSSESVLWSHEDWITDLKWRPASSETDKTDENVLLSTSADRSMIIWSIDPNSSLWTSSARFGDLHGTAGGYFGSMWGKDNKMVLTHDWGGSFRKWVAQDDTWVPKVGISGHFGSVNGLSWEPNGDFLLSVSSDKTNRLYGAAKLKTEPAGTETWHELNRTQIHGYVVNTVDFLSRTSFVSGSDESVVRVFEAPGSVLARLDLLDCATGITESANKALPSEAMLPALGLSNRAVAEDVASNGNNDEDAIIPEKHTSFNELPLEEDLLKGTLWLETEKLYGHRFDIRAVAVSLKHQLVATTCKASTAEYAVVRVFKAGSWTTVGEPLLGHSLTITNLVFSNDGSMLLTVSRDRGWCLFQYDEAQERFNLISAKPKAHARIIWDGCWSTNGDFFATGSRDKNIKIWSKVKTSQDWDVEQTIALEEPITALAMTQDESGNDIIAAGCENGDLILYCKSSSSSSWTKLTEKPDRIHSSTITRLSFNPTHKLRLASCSEDHSVRVMDIKL